MQHTWDAGLANRAAHAYPSAFVLSRHHARPPGNNLNHLSGVHICRPQSVAPLISQGVLPLLLGRFRFSCLRHESNVHQSCGQLRVPVACSPQTFRLLSRTMTHQPISTNKALRVLALHADQHKADAGTVKKASCVSRRRRSTGLIPFCRTHTHTDHLHSLSRDVS